jgi:Reverse transcriptase (RNA-dependent DNA polymerase)
VDSNRLLKGEPDDAHLRITTAAKLSDYRTAKRAFEKNIRDAKLACTRKFLEELNSLSSTAKLQKIYSGGSAPKIGSLKRNDGTFAMTEEELAETMMEAHCTGASKTETFHIKTRPRIASRSERREISKAVSGTKITNIWKAAPKWKANGDDGIFNALLSNNADLLAEPMAKIIRSAFYLGHCPAVWQTSKIIFLGKEGKTDGTDPKSFRPISLTSAVLKLAETLMKNRLLEKLQFNIHSAKQHAYKKASSTESAIFRAISVIEKQLQSTVKLKQHIKGKLQCKTAKGLALVITVDYSGAFDTLFHEAVYKAMNKSGASSWMTNFIRACNETRLIRSSVDNYTSAYRPTLGTPQGAVFSPTCFNLVMDELLDNLGKGECGSLRSTEVIGFADDIMIIIPFNTASYDEAFALANRKLDKLRIWSESKGLKINPSKTSYSIMHRGNSDRVEAEAGNRTLKCDGKEIERKREFRYLGIWMDERLTWSRQLDEDKKKGSKTLIATSRMLGKSFGLSPFLTKWVYQSICLPRMLYACFAWWDGTPRLCNRLESTRAVAMRMITGAMRAAPLAVLESITGLPKICDTTEQLSANTAARLYTQHRWPLSTNNYGQHQAALKSAVQLGIPCLAPKQRPTGSNPFLVKEKFWRANPQRIKQFTYILKDSTQKNLRWLVHGLDVWPILTRHKCGHKAALSLLHATRMATTLSSKHFATDDAVLLNQAKQRSISATLLECGDNLEAVNIKRITLTRCPSITDADLTFLRNTIAAHLSRGISPTFMDEFKHDSKARLRKATAGYWTNHLNSDRCKRNPEYLKHSSAVFHQYSADTVLDIITWERRDIRILTCMMAGRMLDKKIVSGFKDNYGSCSFCGVHEANHLQHWMGECNAFDALRNQLTDSGGKQASDIEPLAWISFAKECGFAKFAFRPT